MGAGGDVNAFFGIMTMVIAVPTGVKIFNWLFTMYGGKIKFTAAMLWFFGFVITFTIGGMTGVLLAVPAIDFQVHNSLFLVAHFHNTIIGGVVFGYFAGLTYWFPKIFGFRLHERLGRYAAMCWIIGFMVAFLPLYALGFMGATRRLDHYTDPSWQWLFMVAGLGVVIILIGTGLLLLQLAYSIWKRKELRDTTGDPWNGRTLEWSVPSPAPEYNYTHLPEVSTRDPWWETKRLKQIVHRTKLSEYAPITVPKNTPAGMLIAGAAFLMCFGFIWHIWWLSIVSLIGLLVIVIMKTHEENSERIISAKEVFETDQRLRNKTV
jgi:cytochrome o ubiquinol oxidase subunit 1